MATLKSHDKIIFEKLFDRGGYVLDFSDRTYAEFFREHGVDINSKKYLINGTSKMKRLRTFWEIESDVVVGKVLLALLEYAEAVGEVDTQLKRKALTVLQGLMGKTVSNDERSASEPDFLDKIFSELKLAQLNIDHQLKEVVEQRIKEIQKSLKAHTHLSVVFLCGSTLEGLLLDSATKQPQKFNSSKSAPKDKDGKVKQLHEWTLDSLINVAYEIKIISLDVKKYGHALKDFRNYIHPREQAAQGFKPDEHTARISWQVLQAAVADLSGQRKQN